MYYQIDNIVSLLGLVRVHIVRVLGVLCLGGTLFGFGVYTYLKNHPKETQNMVKKRKVFSFKIITPLAILFLTTIVVVIIINRKQLEVQQLNSENIELENVLGARDSLVNELIGAFDSIEQNLSFVNQRRNNLVIEDIETNNPSKKDALIRDIQLMNKMLEESSAKIEELETILNKSGINLRSFKNKIARLNKTIETQNILIVELKTQIEDQHRRLAEVTIQKDSLQCQVLSFQDSINYKEEILAEKDTLIKQQIAELNKGFYAYGTYKELSENGVVSKDGGFLGIFGKNKVLQNDMNEAYFTQLNIIENRIIPLHSKKVNLISEHPANSYKLVEEEGLITGLEIEIPEDFWKITSYAVIEVK